jgi:hypothetical protein
VSEFVRCDVCDARIYLDSDEAYVVEGYCGIYCSAECFCEANATIKTISRETAEDCFHTIYTVPKIEKGGAE